MTFLSDPLSVLYTTWDYKVPRKPAAPHGNRVVSWQDFPFVNKKKEKSVGLTYNNKVDVTSRQVEAGAEGAEHLDARLRPQREDGAADAVHHRRAHHVLRLGRGHVHEEVLDLFV